jgi:hypothetical protein
VLDAGISGLLTDSHDRVTVIERPAEEEVPVSVRYTSTRIRLRLHAAPEMLLFVGATADRPKTCRWPRWRPPNCAAACRRARRTWKRPPLPGRLINAYVDRLLATAEHDSVVGEQFLRVNMFLDPSSALMRPAILTRVIAGGQTPELRTAESLPL